MGYDIEIRDEAAAYFQSLGLSPAGEARVLAALRLYLGEYGDSLRNEPSRRLGHESFYFEVRVPVQDPETLVWHTLRFVVDDSCAEHGALRIAYIEDFPGSPPPLSDDV